MARPVFADPPRVEALEAARTAHCSTDEWHAYIAAGMASQDERSVTCESSSSASDGWPEGGVP